MPPPAVIEIRREICARCDEPCAAYRAGQLNHADPAASCPRVWSGRWNVYGSPAARLGLGDAVAVVAQPIARMIDAVAGTKLANCGGCQSRQAALNALIPDVSHPFAAPLQPLGKTPAEPGDCGPI